MNLPQLTMRRANFADLPAIACPPNVALRTAVSPDGDGLAECLREAFADPTWNAQRIEIELLANTQVLTTIIAIYDGSIVATASLAMDQVKYPDTGIVHWVARHPAHDIKGLGLQVSLAVLHFAAKQDVSSAFLLTDDNRLAAIRTYLRLGFTPDFTHPSHATRWEVINRTLA